MSFILWYKVEIGDASGLGGLGLPVTVTNDALTGAPVVDADITVTMTDGAQADIFEVSLINLPGRLTDMVRNAHAARPLNVTVHLGYFGDPAVRTDASRVLVGRIMSVTGSVGADGLSRTVLYGQEEGGYLLRATPAVLDSTAGGTAVELAGRLAAAAGVPLANGSTLDGALPDFTIRTGSTLDALGALAARAAAPMVVRDRKVHLGRAVGSPTDPAPVALNPDTNLVSLSSSTVEDTAARPAFPPSDPFRGVRGVAPPQGTDPAGTAGTGGAGGASPLQAAPRPPVRTTVDATVLGHPRLRVGQVAGATGLSGVPAGPLRITRVVHEFRVTAGYTAQLQLVAAGPGEPALVTTGVQGVVDRWRTVVDRSRDDNPAIDLGEVTGYATGADGKHLASLHYGQTADGQVAAASVAAPIGTDVDLHDKPIASAFAFHRTGLMTPVYPKMRAVLAHNRGQVNDAVVTGFVWPDNPAQQRPANQPGDYWLALPTELGEDGLPRGKGANDLTDAAGHRVIQTAALHVLVGTDALPEVGDRPDPPADDSITIEHQSGTTITVDAGGAVTISTSDQPITLTNGSVSLQLDGPTVAVS